MENSAVGIIGGGFSGAMVAVQLLQRNPTQQIFIVDTAPRVGEGLAYSTQDPTHLLNVPVGGMSCFPEFPDHFLNWLRPKLASVTASDFVSRQLYGEYIRQVFASRAAHLSNVHFIRGLATDIETRPEGVYQVNLANGEAFEVRSLVLALGHFPPRLEISGLEEVRQSQRYISHFWSNPLWKEINKNDSLLIVGTGLSCVDACLSLKARAHRGPILAVSRRGLLPQFHATQGQVSIQWDLAKLGNANQLLHEVRLKIKEAEENGANWRAVLNALRPITNEVWMRLSLTERRRFLRHLRPLWEVHRHRMAPEVGAHIYEMIAAQRVRVLPGRIQSFSMNKRGGCAFIRERANQKTVKVGFDWLVDCSGPESFLRRIESNVLTSLLENGLIEENSLGIGILVDEMGRAISPRGDAQENIHVIGPLRKGSSWETTAVPELRIQARDIAVDILGHQEQLGRAATAPRAGRAELGL